jgi:ribosomal protein L32
MEKRDLNNFNWTTFFRGYMVDSQLGSDVVVNTEMVLRYCNQLIMISNQTDIEARKKKGIKFQQGQAKVCSQSKLRRRAREQSVSLTVPNSQRDSGCGRQRPPHSAERRPPTGGRPGLTPSGTADLRAQRKAYRSGLE